MKLKYCTYCGNKLKSINEAEETASKGANTSEEIEVWMKENNIDDVWIPYIPTITHIKLREVIERISKLYIDHSDSAITTLYRIEHNLIYEGIKNIDIGIMPHRINTTVANIVLLYCLDIKNK